MSILANNIIVHKVPKYQQQQAGPVRYREALLPVRNEEEDTPTLGLTERKISQKG